jgi:hypothetical protein
MNELTLILSAKYTASHFWARTQMFRQTVMPYFLCFVILMHTVQEKFQILHRGVLRYKIIHACNT